MLFQRFSIHQKIIGIKENQMGYFHSGLLGMVQEKKQGINSISL
jgi:hypothetical protein